MRGKEDAPCRFTWEKGELRRKEGGERKRGGGATRCCDDAHGRE